MWFTQFVKSKLLMASSVINEFIILVAALYITTTPVPAMADGANIISGKVTIIDTDGNSLPDRSNVVVFIDGLADVSAPPADSQLPMITHKGKEFSPRILPIIKGSVVAFFNDDNIYHNVFSLSKAKPFDLGIYPKGVSKLVTFEHTGLVKLYCNIHPNMVSNILVLNNAYFFITKPDGAYEISGVPDGTFALRAWHELGGSKPLQISKSGASTLERNITITLTRKILSHKNKFGKDYKKKY